MRLEVATDPQTAETIGRWVAKRIPAMQGATFGPCAAMGVLDARSIPIAGVVFHEYLPGYKSISMSIAADSPKWLSRSIISGILSYPFGTLGAQRITAVTAPRESAASIVRFLLKFGFQQEGRVRKGLGNTDAIVWGLLSSEWSTSRFNLARQVERKGRRRRRRGTLSLGAQALH